MKLSLTEDQSMIESSATDWFQGLYDFRQRESSLQRDGGSPDVWRGFAEMGWLGLPLPEAFGGLEMGPIEAGLLMRVFGRHLVVEPWHATVLQAARLLALAGTQAQQSRWLDGVVRGDLRLALAHTEAGDRLPWTLRRTVASRSTDGWTITGEKRQVVAAVGAAMWIVSAQAEHELRLFLVDPAASGVVVDAYNTLTGARAADITFDGVAATLLGAEDDITSQTALYQVLAEGLVALGWEATGAMQAALEQTTSYTQQRRQFGQSLAQFQVVQHRLAEMAVHCAEAQAVCELASMRLTLAKADFQDLAGLVKSKVGRAAQFVAQEAVQLHGAMGVCEELPIAATFRLLLAFTQYGGDYEDHAIQRGRKQLESGLFKYSQTLVNG
ncbi:acyl-CoA dehydrogenase [Alcaligenaceae bacterium B3P038]|nr:acyl-CoA dehydrogenase [Alcaligenaceae bacterium B3P038]